MNQWLKEVRLSQRNASVEGASKTQKKSMKLTEANPLEIGQQRQHGRDERHEFLRNALRVHGVCRMSGEIAIRKCMKIV